MKRPIFAILVAWAVMPATAHAGGDPARGAQEFKQSRCATRRDRTRCRWSDHRLMALLAVFGGVGLTTATPPGSSPGRALVGFGMMLRWIDGWLGRRRWYPAQRWRWTDWMTHNNGQTSLPI